MLLINNMKWYKAEELAEMLKLDPQTIRIYCRRGTLKAQKIGRLWYVSAANLQAFIDGPKDPGGPQAQAAE